MVAPKSKAPCPCGSGAAYGDCCGPLHRGEREPSTPAALVRARFCAFALGEIEFLWATLHDDHPDRVKHGRDRTLVALRAASSGLRFRGLTILEERPEDEHGFAQCLYHARIFRKGEDVSFVELADFLRQTSAAASGPRSALRYRGGKVVEAAGKDPGDLTIELLRLRGTTSS